MTETLVHARDHQWSRRARYSEPGGSHRCAAASASVGWGFRHNLRNEGARDHDTVGSKRSVYRKRRHTAVQLQRRHQLPTAKLHRLGPRGFAEGQPGVTTPHAPSSLRSKGGGEDRRPTGGSDRSARWRPPALGSCISGAGFGASVRLPRCIVVTPVPGEPREPPTQAATHAIAPRTQHTTPRPATPEPDEHGAHPQYAEHGGGALPCANGDLHDRAQERGSRRADPGDPGAKAGESSSSNCRSTTTTCRCSQKSPDGVPEESRRSSEGVPRESRRATRISIALAWKLGSGPSPMGYCRKPTHIVIEHRLGLPGFKVPTLPPPPPHGFSLPCLEPLSSPRPPPPTRANQSTHQCFFRH